jgi:hypothetical protein
MSGRPISGWPTSDQPAPERLGAEAPLAIPAPPSFTAADLAAACEQGREEGAALAARSDTARAARALRDIAAGLDTAAAAAADLADAHAGALAALIVEALIAAFPSLEARLGPAEAAALVDLLLPGLAREPAVSVRVAPGGVAAIEALLTRLPDPRRGRVTVEADARLGDAAVAVEWRDGGAVRDDAAIRAAVLAAIAGLARATGTDGEDA